MKIRDDIIQNTGEWEYFREGKITGSTIGKLFSKSRKTGEMFDTDKPLITLYQKVAERLTVGAGDITSDKHSATEWGHKQEAYAIAQAARELGITRNEIATDHVWQDTTNNNFAESPDAYENSSKPTWAMEVKCLSSARHIMAIDTDEWPQEYIPQVINYFLINENLKVMYFVMYDPRFVDYPNLQLKIWTVKREDLDYEIEQLRNIREEAEAKINNIIAVCAAPKKVN